jgi:hypothetical protein
LQLARARLKQEADKDDTGAIASALFDFIKVGEAEAFALELFNQETWLEAFTRMIRVESENLVPGADQLAILRSPSGGKPVMWDHPNRPVIIWTHIFASAYGWSSEYTMNLWPEEALALLQEIIADEQQQREFLHSLSEIAYPYDKGSKKNRFKPLSRPAWMAVPGRERTVRMRRDMLPVGTILRDPGRDDA